MAIRRGGGDDSGGGGAAAASSVSLPQSGATIDVPFEFVVEGGLEVSSIPEQPRITLRRAFWRDFLAGY